MVLLHILLPIPIELGTLFFKGHLFWKRVSLPPHCSFCMPRDKASPHLPAMNRFCYTGVCQLSLWTVPSHLPAVLHEKRWGWVASGCLLSPSNPDCPAYRHSLLWNKSNFIGGYFKRTRETGKSKNQEIVWGKHLSWSSAEGWWLARGQLGHMP